MANIRYRIYADGTIIHQDDFADYDNNPQLYDDYQEVNIPDEIIDHIENSILGK